MLTVDTSINTDNPFNNNTFDKYIKNNEENDGHKTDFNLYSISSKYLF